MIVYFYLIFLKIMITFHTQEKLIFCNQPTVPIQTTKTLFQYLLQQQGNSKYVKGMQYWSIY